MQNIGLKSDNGFPHSAYCFTDGQLSVQIEKNGGLNELHYLKVWETGETFHVERYAAPILSKKHVKDYSYGLYGPVLRFISTDKKNNNFYHVPDKVNFLPFGFTSSSDRFQTHMEYDLCIKDRNLIFSFKNSSPNRDKLQCLFATPGLAKGQFMGWLNPEGSELDYSAERRCAINWQAPVIDKKNNALRVDGEIFRYIGPNEKTCLTIAGNNQVSISRQEDDFIILSMDWEDNEQLDIVVSFQEDFASCLKETVAILKNPQKVWEKQIDHYSKLGKSIPQIDIPQYPVAAEMARTIPLFIDAMKINETKNMVTNRAATHKFGYYPHWDVQWTQRSTLLWGYYDFVKKVINHSLTYFPKLEYSHQCELIVLIWEYFSCTKDKNSLKKWYKECSDVCLSIIKKINKQGLQPGKQYGCDDPAQLRQGSGLFYTPESTAWIFNAVRCMENMAMIMDDKKAEKAFRKASDLIQANYLDNFYNEEKGYLYSAISADTNQKLDVYQNVTSIAMEGPYGDLLLDEKIEKLAAFQKNELYHPSGRSSVPFWTRTDEMWKSCIMLQHSNHEMATARWAKESKELMRMWQVYLDLFASCKLQIETINLCGMAGDQAGQRADWQAFTCSAQYKLLLQSIIGVESDIGGLTYLPCDMPFEANIKKLPLGNALWDVSITGKGNWVKSFIVDGKEVSGSYKTPACCGDNKKHSLVIERGSKPSPAPCILRAYGAGITVTKSDKKSLTATIEGTGRVPVRFSAPSKPQRYLVDNKEVNCVWNKEKKTGVIEVVVRNEATLTIGMNHE
jgi:hypothetical protein